MGDIKKNTAEAANQPTKDLAILDRLMRFVGGPNKEAPSYIDQLFVENGKRLVVRYHKMPDYKAKRNKSAVRIVWYVRGGSEQQ